MAGYTNRGKARIGEALYRGVSLPANYFVALCTNATPPTADTNTLGQLTEIAAGNGYASGGISLSKNATDFDFGGTAGEDDAADLADTQIRDLVWTASGGSIPASGSGARWAVLTDANATVGSREVWHYWDLSSDRVVSDGQPLTLQNCTMRLAEA